MEKTKEEWMETLGPLLSGINCYNPTNIDTLERYVQFQAANSTEYDFDANLTLMKLYQFQPMKFNHDIVCKILIKSIMALPNVHLSLLLSVLPLNQQNNEDVRKISLLCTHLESCSFSEFWSSVEDCNDIVDKVEGFREAVKNYIVDLVNNTYQTIDIERLKMYLGNVTDDELSQIVSQNEWKVNQNTVYIRGQEEIIKPKRILAKIEFESVSNIIASAH